MPLFIILLISLSPGDTLYFTLDEAIHYAFENNLDIEQQRLEVAKSTMRVGQTRAAFYPTISVSGGYAHLTDIPVIEFDSIPIPFGQSDNYSVSISLQQVLFAWGKIYSAYRISDISREITELNLVRKKQELRYNVTDAFYSILVLEELVRLSRESLAQLQRHADVVTARYRAGLVPQFDVLRAQVQVANVKPQVINAENALLLTREGFKMLLGMEMDREFAITGILEMFDEDFSLVDLMEEAIMERVELKTLRKTEQIAHLGQQIARRANLPSIVGGASYERSKPFGFTGDDWGSNMTFSLGFQFTLFNGFSNLYGYRLATLQRREAELGYEYLQNAIILEVKQAYLRFMAAQEALVAAQDNMMQAEETFGIIEKRYQNGLATNLEYMDVQLAATQAQTNYLSALKDYYASRAAIQRSIGKEE